MEALLAIGILAIVVSGLVSEAMRKKFRDKDRLGTVVGKQLFFWV
jgi:hypothetical protein